MAYTVSQGLSWLYVNSTGQLYIVDSVNVENLPANTHVNNVVSPISNGSCDITLSESSGPINSQFTVLIYYLSIGTYLNNESAVRAVITNLNMINVRVGGTNFIEDQSQTTTISSILIV